MILWQYAFPVFEFRVLDGMRACCAYVVVRRDWPCHCLYVVTCLNQFVDVDEAAFLDVFRFCMWTCVRLFVEPVCPIGDPISSPLFDLFVLCASLLLCMCSDFVLNSCFQEMLYNNFHFRVQTNHGRSTPSRTDRGIPICFPSVWWRLSWHMTTNVARPDKLSWCIWERRRDPDSIVLVIGGTEHEDELIEAFEVFPQSEQARAKLKSLPGMKSKATVHRSICQLIPQQFKFNDAPAVDCASSDDHVKKQSSGCGNIHARARSPVHCPWFWWSRRGHSQRRCRHRCWPQFVKIAKSGPIQLVPAFQSKPFRRKDFAILRVGNLAVNHAHLHLRTSISLLFVQICFMCW